MISREEEHITGGAKIRSIILGLNDGLISSVLSSIISFSMLFIVGILKTKITIEKKIKSGFEMILIGIVAFLASYGIGTLFEQLIVVA
jgi:VIT1/CCC1 family predicted Fe2+/Mn2+ transporter